MPPRTEKSAKTARQHRRLLNALALNLRRLRGDRGWSQEEAAHRSEMSVRVYQRVESARSDLTFITLARLCAAFDAEAVDLLTLPRPTRPAGQRRRAADERA